MDHVFDRPTGRTRGASLRIDIVERDTSASQAVPRVGPLPFGNAALSKSSTLTNVFSDQHGSGKAGKVCICFG